MAEKLRAIGTNVIISILKKEVKEGKIQLPDAYKTLFRCEVVAAGPGTKDEPMEVKRGDQGLMSSHGFRDDASIQFDGVDVYVVRQRDIDAVIEPRSY